MAEIRSIEVIFSQLLGFSIFQTRNFYMKFWRIKMLKRVFVITLAGFATMLMLGVAAHAAFSDVPRSHWAYDAIDYLEAEGFVTGYPDGTFRGENELSRYEFAMVISRIYDQFMERMDDIDVPSPSIDTNAILDMLMDEFEGELDDLRSLIVSNIERIEDLEGTVDGMEDRIADAVNERVDAMDARFHPYGDIRLRFEGKYPDDGLQTQRPRFRLRWGFTSDITDELTFGARFGSGSEGGITSTNRTIDDYFGFDHFTIDRAYIQWQPASAPGFTLWGGKFSPPWETTVLSWDSDVMVEGIAQHYNHENFNFYLGELVPNKEGFYLVAQAGADDLFVEGFDAYVTYHYINDDCWRWMQDDMMEGELKNRFDFDRLEPMDNYSAIEALASWSGNVGDMPVSLTGSYFRNLADAAAELPDDESAWNQAAWAQLKINGSPSEDGDWQLGVEWGRAQANSVLSWLTDADRGSGDHEWWGASLKYQLMRKTTLGITWLSVDRISRDDHYDLFQVDIATKF